MAWVSGKREKGVDSQRKPSTAEWLLCVGLILAVVLLAFWSSYSAERAQDGAFAAMSPAQHLEAASRDLRLELFSDGLKHAKAIPKSAPEAPEARKLIDDLVARKNAADVAAAKNEEELAVLQRARIAEQRDSAKAAEDARKAAIRTLQDNLKNLGYNYAVEASHKPEEIVVTSADFADTDHRVRFLSFIRGRSSPAGGVCLAGFQTLRLKDASWLGFNEAYSLDCFTAP